MTRKLISIVLAAALLWAACGAALAETTYYGDMTVVNCEEWVSLRDVPGTGGKRLAKVPLGATVTDAEWEPICGDFIYCCYEGQYGYVLSQYLEEASTSNVVMDEWLNGLHLTAERTYLNGGEYLLVTCDEADGAQRWFYETMTRDITELTLTTAFLGGAAQDPMVMVYNAEQGLMALDAFFGDVQWQLTDVHLGASNTWATNGYGITYIGGYYGPDPVAINYDGTVLWQADSGDCAWLYQMELTDESLTCWYDLMDKGGSGQVVFDLDGRLLDKRYD